MRTLPRAAAALALLSALTVSGLAAAPAQAAPAASATQATVATSTVAAASKTRITTQPKSVGIRGTQKATFKVKAVGSKLRYQWYVKAPGKKSFKAIKGATKASYTTPKQANKTRSSQYRVVVAGSRGKVTSKSATLKVKAYASTKITTQPKSASIRGKQTATFSVKAAGESLRYQWQVKAAGKKTFVNVKGATKASYTTPKASNTTATSQYRVAVAGKGGTATSSAATLKVTAWAKPTLKSGKAPRLEFKKGKRVTISGKNLAGSRVSIGSLSGGKVALKLVSQSNTALVFEATADGFVDVQKVVVSNAAGTSSVEVLLMSKHAPQDHTDAWNMMVDEENLMYDDFYGWESDFAADVEFAFAAAKANEKALWEPIDVMSWAVVYYARDAQNKMYDPSVSQKDFEVAFEDFEGAVSALKELLAK